MKSLNVGSAVSAYQAIQKFSCFDWATISTLVARPRQL